MEKIMVTLPPELLEAIDSLSRKGKRNRSQLVREALQQLLHLKQQEEFEALLAEGYQEMAEEDLKDAEGYLSSFGELEYR